LARHGVRIYQMLPVRCKECGAPVRMAMTQAGKEALAKAIAVSNLQDDEVLQSYQCARKRPDGSLCNALVEIKARHWRGAIW